jgi:hypothetical protein
MFISVGGWRRKSDRDKERGRNTPTPSLLLTKTPTVLDKSSSAHSSRSTAISFSSRLPFHRLSSFFSSVLSALSHSNRPLASLCFGFLSLWALLCVAPGTAQDLIRSRTFRHLTKVSLVSCSHTLHFFFVPHFIFYLLAPMLLNESCPLLILRLFSCPPLPLPSLQPDAVALQAARGIQAPVARRDGR